MTETVKFEKGCYGSRAIVNGTWKDSYVNLLLKRNVKELELNQGKGWKGESIDFLKSLPDLKSFIIRDFTINSIDPVHNLVKLNQITISTYCDTPIDFSVFRNLSDCSLEWRKSSESLFDVKTLNKLYINNYDKKNSEVFSNLINLKELSILNAKIEDVNGLSNLKKLKKLRLGNLKYLTSLKGIEELNNLVELKIQRCKKLKKITELFELDQLESLMLLDLGEIDSIKGIEALKNLTIFLFYESTKILDGDLSPILKLKNLEKISFQNRRHYTHRREEFGNLYSS